MAPAEQLNLHHLRSFYEIARRGNMKRAAGHIGVSQPALSKQLQALEETLTFSLFKRSPRGLTLTPEGERVYDHCVRMFGHLRDLGDTIDGLRTGSAGCVEIASVPSIGIHLLPEWLERFREVSPSVRLHLFTCRSASVIKAVREHRADVGLVAGRKPSEGLVVRPFMSSRLRIVVGASHPLAAAAGGPPLDPDVLDSLPIVTFDADAPTRLLGERHLRKLGVAWDIAAESSDIEVLKRLVSVGLGFAVLPAFAIERELRRGDLIALDVEGFDVSRDLFLVHRDIAELPPAIARFVAIFDETAPGH